MVVGDFERFRSKHQRICINPDCALKAFGEQITRRDEARIVRENAFESRGTRTQVRWYEVEKSIVVKPVLESSQLCPLPNGF